MKWDNIPEGNENNVDWSSFANEEAESKSKPTTMPKVVWDDIPAGNGNRI